MTILILTPIPVEFEAVCRHLTAKTPIRSYDMRCMRGNFTGKYHQFEVVVCETGAGNTTAALFAEKAAAEFKPAIILLVGVCGGIINVEVGSVVACTKVYGYESGKETPEDGFVSRPDVFPYSNAIIHLAKTVMFGEEWKIRARFNPAGASVFCGPVASGEKVVATRSSDWYHMIKTRYNDALIVDMEGLGLARMGYLRPDILVGNIRSVSDLLEGKAQADESGSQELAADRAAAFAFECLNQYNGPESADNPDDASTVIVDRSKNVILGSRIKTGGDFRVGDG